MPLSPEDLELVWTELAFAFDEVPVERRDLFLAKLVLALAHELHDPAPALAAIELARASLASDAVPDATRGAGATSNTHTSMNDARAPGTTHH